MSKTGQSFGKRIIKIKVINLDGRNSGFVGTVLIREILFQTIFGIFSYLLIKIFNLNPESTEKTCNYLITFICFFYAIQNGSQSSYSPRLFGQNNCHKKIILYT